MKIMLEENEAVEIVPMESAGWCPICAIRELMPLAEVLTQLAEEASELAQAALKYRRTMSDANPTTVSRREAENALLEEIADVKLCLHVAGLETVENKIAVNGIISAKAERWRDRLEGR